MRVFVLKVLTRYLIKHGPYLYVAFMDASKVFDRVNHTKLFSKLLELGVHVWIMKVLCKWYCNQSLCVRWGSVFSDFFSVNNDVRQGCMLTSVLITSMCLSKLPVGCCCGTTVVIHLVYADGTVLLAPSAKEFQRLLHASYGCDNDILFNSKKSQVMFLTH